MKGYYLMSDAWKIQCIDHWAKSTEFWANYLPEYPQARGHLYHTYDRLGDHLRHLMRADSRAEF